MEVYIKNTCIGWREILERLWKTYGIEIENEFIKHNDVYIGLDIFPLKSDIFKCFTFFSFSDLRVVIIGQDPYINKGEANGLCFSVNTGCKMPPSLRNVFKELNRSYGTMRTNTDLTDWAKQGVLLLNTALTVREHKSASHAKLWKTFTNDLIRYIGQNSRNVVFMLWGLHAQSFRGLIDETCNLVLKHSHPSPLARVPFTGNNHFVLCNEYLQTKGYECIKWL
jgi:uracil-DNA glycosylase